jgi:hypothetical protein
MAEGMFKFPMLICSNTNRSHLSKIAYALLIGIYLGAFFLPPMAAGEKDTSREEAQFKIYISGKEIGKETYSIVSSPEATSSSSVVEFRDPSGNARNIRIETKLTMDAHMLPQSYQLKTDFGGQKGLLAGTFTSGQVMFEISGNGEQSKRGLLVGDHYLILDSNVFHHFIFVVRSFHPEGNEKTQSFEVVVPQELDDGVLKITDLGKNRIPLRGKDKDLHHWRADSGQLLIDLWIDDQQILQKIAIPAKKVEVIRNP